jgi:DNA-binding transcriptional regulator YdaS (Cro superfamily)
MDLIRDKRGMLAKLASEMGVTRAAVVKWKRVPAERLIEIERITGIARDKLRPDLFEATTLPQSDASVRDAA